jgi:two-component sensor histidine kinase
MPEAQMLRTVPDALFSKVFITEEMLARPISAADFRREKLAIQELAARMLDAPGDVLPRFVELAMEMLDGCSAGLSLYEPSPRPGIFRWNLLCGTLATFEGATTPRNYSPCGITLDQAAPVLTRHSELAYSWIADANIILPEVLLVPIFIGGSEPLGTLWIVSNVDGHFTSEHARVASELATFVGIALHVQRSESRLRQALETQETLTREMSHRVKNLFAVTDAMIRQSVKGSATKEDMAEALSGRLNALASAHSLVLRNASAPIEAIDLKKLVAAVVMPHDHASTYDNPRIVIGGPSLTCNERNASSIALVFNEFAANAVKYGSLGDADGSVAITWTVEDNTAHFLWTERGGPPVESPTRKGFGSKLVEITVVRQLAGSLKYDWQADGLVASFSLPLSVFQVD